MVMLRSKWCFVGVVAIFLFPGLFQVFSRFSTQVPNMSSGFGFGGLGLVVWVLAFGTKEITLGILH